MDIQGWMREARQGTYFMESRQALDSIKTQILCNAELRQDFAKYVVLFKHYIMQTKVNKPQELNISSTATKTKTDQKKRKPQGRVENRNNSGIQSFIQ